MSQALYRKYRSQRFAELVGQHSVTRVLRNAILRERLGHAYLFCGPRGTGKTSVARIFAKAVNCLDPHEGDCCGECEICCAVAEGRAADVIEIDAASYRQVDEIKEILIDRVGYAPQACQRKIYIIDEVHMLSAHSFNALLKTLEEPPGHVVFCLCTTEPHKLPLTILSRCIRFDFHRLPFAELAAHLQHIAQTEGFNLAEDAARELAVLAEGSARDSISLLDQLLVYCEYDISLAAVRELFQLSDPQLLTEAVSHLAQQDPAPLIAIWENLAAQGADAGQFLIRLSAAVKDHYLETGEDGWRRALAKLWEGLNLLKYESFPALLVELTLLSAQQAHSAQPGNAPLAHDTGSNRARVSQAVPAPSQPVPPTVVSVDRRAHVGSNVEAAASTPPNSGVALRSGGINPRSATPLTQPPVPVALLQDAWQLFLTYLERQAMTTYALVQEGVIARKDEGLLRLVFDPDSRAAYRYIQQEKYHQPLQNALSAAYGNGLRISVEIAGDQASRVFIGADSPSDTRTQVAGSGQQVIEEAVAIQQLEGLDASLPAQITGAPVVEDDSTTHASAAANSRPATKQDILELFDGVEINNSEAQTGVKDES